MPVLTRSRQAIRVAGAATAAAPYVREVATDRDLREAARTSFRAAGSKECDGQESFQAAKR